jgi:hypothetical protein
MTIFITTISVFALLSLGFLGGITYSAWVMCKKVEETRNKILEKTPESTCLVPRYQHATTVAAQCWCDPRTIRTPMDTVLGTVFAEKIAEYIDALQWCSGSADFGPDGRAWIGFERVCRPLMRMDHKIDISKLTPALYKSLCENAPELLGLKG